MRMEKIISTKVFIADYFLDPPPNFNKKNICKKLKEYLTKSGVGSRIKSGLPGISTHDFSRGGQAYH